MSEFISRLLVFIYIILLPLFYGLYVASMLYSYPKQDALWIEGGATDFGPAAFLVLLALLVIPLMLSTAKYLVADDSSDMFKVLIISAILSVYPVLGAIQAHHFELNFPIQVLYAKSDFIFSFAGLFCAGFVFVLPVSAIIDTINGIHVSSSAKAARRKKMDALKGRFRVSALDIDSLHERLITVSKTTSFRFRSVPDSEIFDRYLPLHLKIFSRLGFTPDDYVSFVQRALGSGAIFDEKALEIFDRYLPLHLKVFSKIGLTPDDYVSFVQRALGRDAIFDEKAFDELERHVQSCLDLGGVEQHFRWLSELVRAGCKDEAFDLYFRGHYCPKVISLNQALLEYRVGEFTSPEEYLSFAKEHVGYVSSYEKAAHEKELAKMTHPVLVRMFDLGGVYRSRALQIVRRSPNAAKVETPKAIIPDAGIPAAPTPPQVTKADMVMISRGGQVILRDIKLQNLPTLVMQGQVLMTDHYWCSGMAGWSLVSAYRSVDAPRQVTREGINWGEILTDFLLSWLLYVLGGLFIAGLIGYGNGGMSGVGSAIGGFLGFIILVRPVTFVFRTLFRLIIGKRGIELFR